MLRLGTCIGLLTLLATISAEHHHVHHGEPPRVTGRLGFSILEQLRQSFCHTFCTSADTMPYLANLMCAAKCPELYLPHGTTTSTTPGATTPSTSGTAAMTPIITTTTAASTTSTTMSTPMPSPAMNMSGGTG